MQPETQTLILLAVFVGALAFPWRPARYILDDFLGQVQVLAKVDKDTLDERRKKQREQAEAGIPYRRRRV